MLTEGKPENLFQSTVSFKHSRNCMLNILKASVSFALQLLRWCLKDVCCIEEKIMKVSSDFKYTLKHVRTCFSYRHMIIIIITGQPLDSTVGNRHTLINHVSIFSYFLPRYGLCNVPAKYVFAVRLYYFQAEINASQNIRKVSISTIVCGFLFINAFKESPVRPIFIVLMLRTFNMYFSVTFVVNH